MIVKNIQPTAQTSFRAIYSNNDVNEYFRKRFDYKDFTELNRLVDEHAQKKPDIFLQMDGYTFKAHVDNKSFKAGMFCSPLRAIKKAISYAEKVNVPCMEIFHKMSNKRH